MKDIFIICGAQRSGTTYLYYLLDDHPEIYMAKPVWPEPKYFGVSKEYQRGKEYYWSRYFEHAASSHHVLGEKSTCYMELACVPKRIYKDFPSTKLVFILRNPIDRAVSNYCYSVNNGFETESFDHAIYDETRRVKLNKMENLSNHPFAYLRRGCYMRHIQRYLEYFDVAQMYFIILEELCRDRARILKNLYKFLDVDMTFQPARENDFVNPTKKETDVINKRNFKYMKEYFESDTEKLEVFLKRKLPAWRVN